MTYFTGFKVTVEKNCTDCQIHLWVDLCFKVAGSKCKKSNFEAKHGGTNRTRSHTKTCNLAHSRNEVSMTYFTGRNRPPKSGR